jgi:predicted DNA-binding transcriptional regulator YafY
MIICANFIYDSDPGGAVLIDLNKVPSNKEGNSFKKSIQKAISTKKSITMEYEIAQSDAVFSSIIQPPQFVEEVIDIYVE